MNGDDQLRLGRVIVQLAPQATDQLMDQIRNREWVPNDRSIDVLVGRLRRKLHDDPAEPQLIITIHGTGYLFTASVAA